MGVGDDEVGPAAEPQELDPKAQREVVEVLVEGEPVQQLNKNNESEVHPSALFFSQIEI